MRGERNVCVGVFSYLLPLTSYLFFYQKGLPRLIGMIVRRGADDVLVAALDDEQMAILDARDELHALAAFTLVDGLGQMLIEILDQHVAVLRLQITAIVSDNLTVFQRDDIAANGKVIVGHLIAYRCSLQRATSFVHLIQVVAENSRICHLGAWRESLGHRDEPSATTVAGQLVHHRLTGILQEGLPAETLDGKISHSIT